MSKRAFLTATTLALATVMCFQIAATAGEQVGDIEVSLQPLPNKDNRSGRAIGTRHGYVEYRVQLKNSATEDHIVHLSHPGTRDGRVSYGVVTSRTVRVAGGQEVAVSLYQPAVAVGYGTMEVHVEGVRDAKNIPVESLHGWYDPSNSPRMTVLLSRNVPQDFRDLGQPKAAAKPPGRPTPAPVTSVAPPSLGTPTDPFALLRSELSVSQWSPNWLGYSCYDVIVLTGNEAEEMPPQVQLAVRRYLECGGTLLIHGPKVPAVFSQGGIHNGQGVYGVGFGCALASLADTASQNAKSATPLQALSNHLVTNLNDDKTGWGATWAKLKTLPVQVYQPLEKPAKLYDLLLAETTVPVRGLFALVLLFGVGIGPANLWLLSRYKRRIWLWWNVPAISLLTCLAVFGYSLASEGWTGHGKTASLTLLDERCHRATTIGYLSYYCPLTPSVGPRFGVDSDVTLLENKLEPWRRYSPMGSTNSLRLVDWTNDQHLTAGWVTARVPAYFQIRKNEDRRERLTIEKQADGSLKIVNALGADIQRLYVADPAGHVFEGRDIPAGAERTLLAAVNSRLAPEGGQTLLRNIFHSADWLGGFRNWAESKAPAAMLTSGCYIAYLDKSPFVESPLAGVKSEDSVAIVYGISKGTDDGR
jgi:hypothetical protein